VKAAKATGGRTHATCAFTGAAAVNAAGSGTLSSTDADIAPLPTKEN
jgi:hypothetical protein